MIVDRLIKSAHFIPVRIDYSMHRLAKLYVDEIVRLHGTQLNFSTTFHPQTDGQYERLIQVLEDMLRECVMDFTRSWDRYISLIEFSYNNSYQSSIGMTPYEALYGRRFRTPVCWTKLNEHKVIGPDIVKDT